MKILGSENVLFIIPHFLNRILDQDLDRFLFFCVILNQCILLHKL